MAPLSERAKAVFSWPDDLRHAPGPPDDEKGGFRSKCRCGWPGKWVKASPSHAYQVTHVHAKNENARERAGGPVLEIDQYGKDGDAPRSARQSTPSRPSVGSSGASRGVPGTPCGCGCGEPRGGGLFRPGHDSKLLSRLQSEVRAGTKTTEQALDEVKQVGASEKLIAKLAGRLSA